MDIVTDTLHASSSDVITWNTLAMVRLNLQDNIPIAHGMKLPQPPLWHLGMRATGKNLSCLTIVQEVMLVSGHVGMTSTGKPSQTVPSLTQYPLRGLGFCDKSECSAHFTTYCWSRWSSKTAQPMQVDQGILDMLNGPDCGSAGTGGSTNLRKTAKM